VMGSSPHNRWDRHSDSAMVKLLCENQNIIQPKFDVDIEPKSTPLKNLGQQQANQWLRGPSKTHPFGGDEVPKILDSKDIRRSYEYQCEISLIGEISFIKESTLQGN
jgi:hypothetical protein